MLTPKYTGQFKRDVKKLQGSGDKDLKKMKDVIRKIIDGEPLEPRHRDHPLRGDWTGCRDCHIEPDWLLLYKVDHG